MLGLFVSILICCNGSVRSVQFNCLWLTLLLPLHLLLTYDFFSIYIYIFICCNLSSNIIKCKLVTWKYIKIHSLGSFHSISPRLSANLVLPPQRTILNAFSLLRAFFSLLLFQIPPLADSVSCWLEQVTVKHCLSQVLAPWMMWKKYTQVKL